MMTKAELTSAVIRRAKAFDADIVAIGGAERFRVVQVDLAGEIDVSEKLVPSGDERIHLPAHRAEVLNVSGKHGLRISPVGMTEGWTDPQDALRWNFTADHPGKYQVEITVKTGFWKKWDWNHEINIEIDNQLLGMTVADDGLHIRVDLDTEGNAEARSLYSAVSRGDISGMSFMFRVDSDEWEDLDSERPLRTITGISKVFEVSAVTWPAYEQTSLEARSHAKALDSAASVLESARDEHRRKKEREDLIKATLQKLEENRNV